MQKTHRRKRKIYQKCEYKLKMNYHLIYFGLIHWLRIN